MTVSTQSLAQKIIETTYKRDNQELVKHKNGTRIKKTITIKKKNPTNIDFGERFFSKDVKRLRGSKKQWTTLFRYVPLIEGCTSDRAKDLNARIVKVNKKIKDAEEKLWFVWDGPNDFAKTEDIKKIVGDLLVETVHFRKLNEKNRNKWQDILSQQKADEYEYGDINALEVSLKKIEQYIDSLDKMLLRCFRDEFNESSSEEEEDFFEKASEVGSHDSLNGPDSQSKVLTRQDLKKPKNPIGPNNVGDVDPRSGSRHREESKFEHLTPLARPRSRQKPMLDLLKQAKSNLNENVLPPPHSIKQTRSNAITQKIRNWFRARFKSS